MCISLLLSNVGCGAHCLVKRQFISGFRNVSEVELGVFWDWLVPHHHMFSQYLFWRNARQSALMESS